MRFIRDIIENHQQLSAAQRSDGTGRTNDGASPADRFVLSGMETNTLELSEEISDLSVGDQFDGPEDSCDQDAELLAEDQSLASSAEFSRTRVFRTDLREEMESPTQDLDFGDDLGSGEAEEEPILGVSAIPDLSIPGDSASPSETPEQKDKSDNLLGRVVPPVERNRTRNSDAEAAANSVPLPLRARSKSLSSESPPVARIHAVSPHTSEASDVADESNSPALKGKGPDAPTDRSGRDSGARMKTRLLGFAIDPTSSDPISGLNPSQPDQHMRFPVGWIVVVDGPGCGHSFQLSQGVNQIGRADSQNIRLDFGDDTISRFNHAAIAYDAEQNTFYIGHGGKANIVRRNNRPVLSTEEMLPGDIIRVGETTLRFMPFCGEGFSWGDKQNTGNSRELP